MTYSFQNKNLSRFFSVIFQPAHPRLKSKPDFSIILSLTDPRLKSKPDFFIELWLTRTRIKI